MGKIRVLSEVTINQIAAGEVIENPCSVVKELVENSLDAGATKIWVEIRGGGLQLIQVADNGIGMSPDDAILSFERHATSKLASIEDLNQLRSMGFRGEALASIAAISRLQLVTAEEGKDGVEIDVDGGAIRGSRAASRSCGTTVSIRSLFYNVPARKKFQKSTAAATAEIHKFILSIALAHPEVGLELTVSDSVILSTLPERDPSFLINLENRIETLFEDSFLQTRREISMEKNGYQIQGFLGSAVDDRVNRSGQYLYINRRYVISPLVSYAIKAGYGHRLDERRHPIFVVHLSLPPDQLDVNVHPQKREVRFQNEGFIKQFLQGATQSALEHLSSSSAVSFSDLPPMKFPETTLRFREEQEERVESWIEDPEVIGIFGVYLLLNASTIPGKGEGIIWVHLQKAQEKILMQELLNSPAEGRSQGLLLPTPLALTKQESLLLQEKHALLSQMGFSIEPSGKESYLIHALPTFIEIKDGVEAVRLILEGEEVYQKLAAFAMRRKKRFMIQEGIALWHRVKTTLDKEIIAQTGPDVIENFFR